MHNGQVNLVTRFSAFKTATKKIKPWACLKISISAPPGDGDSAFAAFAAA